MIFELKFIKNYYYNSFNNNTRHTERHNWYFEKKKKYMNLQIMFIAVMYKNQFYTSCKNKTVYIIIVIYRK